MRSKKIQRNRKESLIHIMKDTRKINMEYKELGSFTKKKKKRKSFNTCSAWNKWTMCLQDSFV